MMLSGGIFFSSSLLFSQVGANLALAKFGALAGSITQVAEGHAWVLEHAITPAFAMILCCLR